MTVKIGNINVGSFPLLLAPMEDVSDPPLEHYVKSTEQMLCIQNLYLQKD